MSSEYTVEQTAEILRDAAAGRLGPDIGSVTLEYRAQAYDRDPGRWRAAIAWWIGEKVTIHSAYGSTYQDAANKCIETLKAPPDLAAILGVETQQGDQP